MLVERRDEQNAADAAALAGARYVVTDPPRPRRRPGEIAQVNGFDDADPNQTVTIHIPPIHGRYVGFAGFIEVQIEGTKSVDLRRDHRAVRRGRSASCAVATNRQDLTFPFSMLALNPTACKAIAVSGRWRRPGLRQHPIEFERRRLRRRLLSASAGRAARRSTSSPQMRHVGSSASSRTRAADRRSRATRPRTRSRCRTRSAISRRHQSRRSPPPMLFAGTGDPAPAIPKNCPGGDSGAQRADLAALQDPGQPAGHHPCRGSSTRGCTRAARGRRRGAIAYLMPGIYWIGGGGLVIDGGASICHGRDGEPDATPYSRRPRPGAAA